MENINSEYLSIRHLAIKYDLHPDTIRKQDLIEGVHYIRIGRTIRYHVNNMHKYFCSSSNQHEELLDKFLIDEVLQ